VVVRTVEGKVQTMSVDLSRFYRTGDKAYNPEMRDGDTVYVSKDRSINWDFTTQAISSYLFVRAFFNTF